MSSPSSELFPKKPYGALTLFSLSVSPPSPRQQAEGDGGVFTARSGQYGGVRRRLPLQYGWKRPVYLKLR